MNATLTTALAALGIIGTLGGLAAWFSRSRGTQLISLLQKNIAAYKDAQTLDKQRIAYLEGQNANKDETIKNLNQIIKELKDGQSK